MKRKSVSIEIEGRPYYLTTRAHRGFLELLQRNLGISPINDITLDDIRNAEISQKDLIQEFRLAYKSRSEIVDLCNAVGCAVIDI